MCTMLPGDQPENVSRLCNKGCQNLSLCDKELELVNQTIMNKSGKSILPYGKYAVLDVMECMPPSYE